MDVKTKFNRGDIVYYIENSKIKKGNVEGLRIFYQSMSRDIGIFTNKSEEVHYWILDSDKFHKRIEAYVFATKESAIEHVLSELKE